MNTMTTLGDSKKDEGLVSYYTVFFHWEKVELSAPKRCGLLCVCVCMFSV